MSKKNKPQTEQVYGENTEKNSTRAYFFIAIGVLIVALITLGLVLVPNIGVYMLIASITETLAALAFLSTQKKVNNFKAVFYVTIGAYVILAIGVLLFAGGLIYVATLK